jgi:ubiquinone/menaquinone biosynthesis C-methylase UbiE
MSTDTNVAVAERGENEPFADWLLRHRHGGDPATREQILARLVPVRERILDNAAVEEGDVVLDVGCGDGLVGFAALDRVGPRGRVIFSDQSPTLLDACRSLATTGGVAERCEFRETALPGLDAIASQSVDVVLTRAVVMYVKDKAGCLIGMHRVLRPGGRISLLEPISRVLLAEPADELYGYDVSGCVEAAAKVRAAYVGPSAEENPIVNFDERDLIRHAEDAGFSEITLDLTVLTRVTTPNVVRDWDTFFHMSPNPTAPPIGEVIAAVLAADEAQTFEACIRSQLDAGTKHMRYADAFLRATKPA